MLRRLNATLDTLICHAIGQLLSDEWEAVPTSLKVSAIDDGPDRGRVAIVINVRKRQPVNLGFLKRR